METMMNEEEQHVNELPDILEPIAVIMSEIPKPNTEIAVPYGYVYITTIDTAGTGQENSGFFYPESKYRKFYGDETKFLVRKSSITISNTTNHENLNRTSQQITFRTTGRCSSCGR